MNKIARNFIEGTIIGIAAILTAAGLEPASAQSRETPYSTSTQVREREALRIQRQADRRGSARTTVIPAQRGSTRRETPYSTSTQVREREALRIQRRIDRDRNRDEDPD